MKSLALWLALMTLPAPAATAESPVPEEIIERFAQSESEFRDVWQQYTYRQHILFQVLGPGGVVREQRQVVLDVFFTRDGKRGTRTVSDRGRLKSVGVTEEDMSDATSLQPFVLTSEEIPEYRITYRGAERVDELDTYVFDVEPRRQEKGKRYFKGRIWVDDQDYQVVMTRGKAVPDYRNNKFPQFETVREQIDGFWFPTWTEADDFLHFGRGNSVHIRQLITYSNFQRFEVDTSIRYEPVDQ